MYSTNPRDMGGSGDDSRRLCFIILFEDYRCAEQCLGEPPERRHQRRQPVCLHGSRPIVAGYDLHIRLWSGAGRGATSLSGRTTKRGAQCMGRRYLGRVHRNQAAASAGPRKLPETLVSHHAYAAGHVYACLSAIDFAGDLVSSSRRRQWHEWNRVSVMHTWPIGSRSACFWPANERMQLTWLTGCPKPSGLGSPALLRATRPRLTRHAADASR